MKFKVDLFHIFAALILLSPSISVNFIKSRNFKVLNDQISKCLLTSTICSGIYFASPDLVHAVQNLQLTPTLSNSILLTKKDISTITTSVNDDFIRGLVSGAVSRASKEIILHPFDTIRARQQISKLNKNNDTHILSSSSSSPSPAINTLSSTKNPTTSATTATSTTLSLSSSSYLFTDLYAGLFPALVGGIPAGALFFGVKDSIKTYLKSSTSLLIDYGIILTKEEITILSVIVANIFYWLIRSPTEILKTKQQITILDDATSSSSSLNSNSSSNSNSNINKKQSNTMNTSTSSSTVVSKKQEINFQYIQSLYQSQGLTATLQFLYSSYNSNIVYALPADIAKFVAYEYISTEVFHMEKGIKMIGINAAIGGAMAGLFAQFFTTPLDVVRTRIMANTKAQPALHNTSIDSSLSTTNVTIISTSNPFILLSTIIQQEGIVTLWSGWLPRSLRAIGSGAIQFVSYEYSQYMMKGE